LYTKLSEAIKKIPEHTELLVELEETCGSEQVVLWKEQVAAWQEDQSVKPDPYQETLGGM
jgi:hypothetical protein